MRITIAGLAFLSVFLPSLTPHACAQEANAFIGFGGAHDSSSHQQFDTFGDGINYPTNGIGGMFVDLGFNVFLKKQIGAGFDISWRGPQATYSGVAYRPLFYSFDAIYQPAKATTKRLSPEFRAGIGGASLRFAPDVQMTCVNGPACQDVHHFQTHLAVAARFYVTTHFFLRPAFDLHYVNNFTEFGSKWVEEYSLGFGYGLGRE